MIFEIHPNAPQPQARELQASIAHDLRGMATDTLVISIAADLTFGIHGEQGQLSDALDVLHLNLP